MGDTLSPTTTEVVTRAHCETARDMGTVRTLAWSDGRRHIGERFDDEAHGRGTLTGVSEYTRTGEWFGGNFKGA